MTDVLDRIRSALVGLKMPRALEALDHTMQRLEQGEISGVEAIDALRREEFTTRERRRIEIALRTAKLMPIKTLESFVFSFQPSLDRERVAAPLRSTSSVAPKWFTSSAHRAPARATWPPL